MELHTAGLLDDGSTIHFSTILKGMPNGKLHKLRCKLQDCNCCILKGHAWQAEATVFGQPQGIGQGKVWASPEYMPWEDHLAQIQMGPPDLWLPRWAQNKIEHLLCLLQERATSCLRTQPLGLGRWKRKFLDNLYSASTLRLNSADEVHILLSGKLRVVFHLACTYLE